METQFTNGEALEIVGGNVAPFKAREKSALIMVQGTGTLTLLYSLDGEHWTEDSETFNIPSSGAINIELYMMAGSYYKVTTSGSITTARIRYE